jgi:hypothetical protein
MAGPIKEVLKHCHRDLLSSDESPGYRNVRLCDIVKKCNKDVKSITRYS